MVPGLALPHSPLLVYEEGLDAVVRKERGLSFSPSDATGELAYIHADHLGTPQGLSDESGNIVWLADYSPFGLAIVNEDPDLDGNTVTLNLRFPGQYFDGESGLHYNYFRDYDPQTGRYIQFDPIGLRGGINTYGYVLQNPIRYTDPSGRAIPLVAVCGVNPAACAAIATGIVVLAGEAISALSDALSGSESFPRPGIIPGTTEHRGELDTPTSTSAPPQQDPSQDKCIDKAEASYEQCISGCKNQEELSICRTGLIIDLLACQQNGGEPPDFWDNNDSPSFEGPDDLPGLF